jgi:hypothetical protein
MFTPRSVTVRDFEAGKSVILEWQRIPQESNDSQ